jgi:hypothetical protein
MPRHSAPIVALALAGALGTRETRAEDAPTTATEPAPVTEQRLRLVVERGAGAEACPDDAALGARIAQIRGRAALAESAYRVQFSHDDAAFGAAVTVEPGGRARTLRSTDTTCDALSNAVAVTLALLIDAAEASAPAPPPPPPEPAPARPIEHTSPRPAKRLAATLSLGGGAVTGVTAPIAPGVAADAGLVVSRFRATLGVLWTGTASASLGPGEVREALLAGRARLCFAPIDGVFRADLCSGALVGSMSAEARGYTRNDTRYRPWIALPLELVGSFWTGHLGAELGVSALLPIERSDFSIDGLGLPYASASIGFMATLGLVAVAPL